VIFLFLLKPYTPHFHHLSGSDVQKVTASLRPTLIGRSDIAGLIINDYCASTLKTKCIIIIIIISVRMLGLIRTVTYSFSTLDSLLILYLTLVTPKRE
jgi:hypothetical protein